MFFQFVVTVLFVICIASVLTKLFTGVWPTQIFGKKTGVNGNKELNDLIDEKTDRIELVNAETDSVNRAIGVTKTLAEQERTLSSAREKLGDVEGDGHDGVKSRDDA